MFSQFSATLQGLTTIRAFHAGHRVQDTFHRHLDAHSRAWLSFAGATRWLAVRLELMSTTYLTVVLFAALLVVDYGSDLNLDAGTLGLSISYQISLYGVLQWVVRTSADTENLVSRRCSSTKLHQFPFTITCFVLIYILCSRPVPFRKYLRCPLQEWVRQEKQRLERGLQVPTEKCFGI